MRPVAQRRGCLCYLNPFSLWRRRHCEHACASIGASPKRGARTCAESNSSAHSGAGPQSVFYAFADPGTDSYARAHTHADADARSNAHAASDKL